MYEILFVAIECDRIEIVKLLILFLDINKIQDNIFALLCAVCSRNYKMTNFLLSKGALDHKVESSLKSCIDYALYLKDKKMIRILVKQLAFVREQEQEQLYFKIYKQEKKKMIINLYYIFETKYSNLYYYDNKLIRLFYYIYL